jgi:glycine hydroxymethyltransferase
MSSAALLDYLAQTPPEKIDTATVAYLANLTETAKVSPTLARSIVQELADQRANLKLIASENYCSLPTQFTMGNLLTDKYAEGYPHSRFYAGCDNVDNVEEYAYEQARNFSESNMPMCSRTSGADANLVAYWAILSARVTAPALGHLGEANPAKLSVADWNTVRAQCGNQRLLGLDYYSGGHLTHGYRHNMSAQMFEAHSYEVSRDSGLLDYHAIEKRRWNSGRSSCSRARPVLLEEERTESGYHRDGSVER